MAYLFNPVDQKSIEFYDSKPQEELTQYYADTHMLLSNPMSEIDEVDHGKPPAAKKAKNSCRRQSQADTKEAYDTAKSIVDLESKVSFSCYPLVKNWAPLVLDSSKLLS